MVGGDRAATQPLTDVPEVKNLLNKAAARGDGKVSLSNANESLAVQSAEGGAATGSAGSSAEAALTAVEAFRNGSATSPWKLDRGAVADRLAALVRNPALVQQGNLNACGPAAFFRVWLARDPRAFVTYAATLYDTGASSIGNIAIKPGSDLLNQDYAKLGVVTPPADWMTMSALRDSENSFWDFEGTPSDQVSGITMPGELAKWLGATGLYSSIRNDGNWFFTRSLDHALALQPDGATDVIVLINARILPGGANDTPLPDFVANAFPNHYIVLLEPFTQQGTTVSAMYWSWGTRAPLTVDKSEFQDSYFGAIVAQAKPPTGEMSFDYSVSGLVPLVGQPNDNACWATAATMLASWKDQASYTIQQVVDRAGPTYRAVLDAKAPLPGSMKVGFLTGLGLKAEPPMDYSVQGFLSVLRASGPLWVTTEEAASENFSVHGRVITGMFGDGTVDGTFLRINDPLPIGSGSQPTPESYRTFMQKFDDVASGGTTPRRLIPQVVHF